jgi:outer membrane protein, multidrug efflux system
MRVRLVFCLGLLLQSVPALAELVTLKSALENIYQQSPDIQQLQAQYDSAVAKRRLALSPAEPTLSFQVNDMPSQFDIYHPASKVIQLQQVLGFPGRALLNRSMMNDQAQAIGYQINAMKIQVGVNVKTVYLALQLAQKNIQLNADTRLSYERIMEIAKRRYESGATSQVDYLNAQVALLGNKNDLADLQAAERSARGQLNVLLKRPVTDEIEVEPLEMSYHPIVNVDEAIERMLNNRNEIKAAQAQVHASDKAYKLAWMSLLPDFQFTLGTTFYSNPYASPLAGDPANQSNLPSSIPDHTYLAGVQITLPIWFLFNERQVISGASNDKVAAERGLDVVLNQSKTAIESAVETLNASRAKVENFERHMVPLSDQALKLALIAYSSGKIDFQSLADTAASHRQTRLSYASTVVNYLTAYATYCQLIGEEQ